MIEKLRCDSRVTEVYSLAFNVIGILQTNDWSSDPFLTSIINEIKGLQVRLKLAINKSQSELLIDEKEIVRDQKLRTLVYLLLGLVNHPDNTINEAANEVKAVFDVYGIPVSCDNAVVESSLINSLLGDLYTSSMTEALSILSGCNTMRDELQMAQSDLENTKLNYRYKLGSDTKSLNASEIKKQLVYVINNKLLVYFAAMYQVNKAVFGDLCIAVAQAINLNNEDVKSRLVESISSTAY